MGRVRCSRRSVLLGGTTLAATGLLGADTAFALAGPRILTREEWDARPAAWSISVLEHAPVKIIVHHTATPNVTDYGLDAAKQLSQEIQRFHMDVRGWPDAGQHFTISRGGVIMEGRDGSLEALRGGKRHVEGAHCTNQNGVALGIENEGTYTATDPPVAVWLPLAELCGYVCARYHIAPTELYGHRDFKDTACPGDVLYGMLDALRTEVARALGITKLVQPKRWPLLRVADQGPPVQAAQHLLRAAGTPSPVHGQFDRDTSDAVRTFQRRHQIEETGMIGGESWPLLAQPVRTGQGGDAAQAVRLLAARRTGRTGATPATPATVDQASWQALLDSR